MKQCTEAFHLRGLSAWLSAMMMFCTYSFAQSQNNLGEEGLRKVSELLEYGDCIGAIGVLDTLFYGDNIAPHYFYFKGVAEGLCGDTIASQASLEKCIAVFDKFDYKDETYLDASLRLIDYFRFDDGHHEKKAELARSALSAPKNVLDSYPNTYVLFERYVLALNEMWKTSEVESIVREGLPYVEKSLSPTQKEYYHLRYMEIIALALMNRWERAEYKLSELVSINQQYGQHVMDDGIAQLSSMLSNHKKFDWHNNADKHLDWAYDAATTMLILNPASTEEGAETWKKFFNVLIDDLELNHYDVSSPKDEKYWSRLLACAIVYFGSSCQEMPGREQVAYNLILLRKNFLDYHTGILHKVPKRWQDVRESLCDGELAIEITMYPAEILIIGKSFDLPIAIPISEEISEQISGYAANDATMVNEYYSKRSPLIGTVNLLKPYLNDIQTIYLSPTNLFAQFNYGAIPYINGRLDDYVNVVQMTTTADIAHYKVSEGLRPSSEPSVLIGGVDYNVASPTEILDNDTERIEFPSEMRSGFGYLPYSLQEVKNIASILGEGESISLTGKDASESAINQLSKSNRTILHLATHGYSIPTMKVEDADSISKITSVLSRTGLLLAGANISLQNGLSGENDGILTSQEIINLDMSNIQLAVLSFCSSGLGDITNITGVVYGVANAMKTSGVGELIISLWDIPDEATAMAMTSFYRHLKSGHTTHEAILNMRKDMISVGYTDPYYWASFIVLD